MSEPQLGSVQNAPERLVEPASQIFRALLTLPSRFKLMARLGGVDAFGESTVQRGGRSSSYNPPPTFTPLPGPWGFVTSGYAAGLVALAIVLNRIQNIVVPPRHLFTYSLPRTTGNRRSLLRTIYYYFLPLDFSSTTPRLIIRIPSLFLMCRALLLWTVILLQTFDIYPTRGLGVRRVGDWVARKETADVCWMTFSAMCVALSVGALTRGLEGTSAPSNAAPFNMFGYSFLLHIYSSSITNVHKIKGLPSRPDKHVVVTIILPLLQLTITHTLGVKQRWSNYRLVPTAIACILGLAHFHTVLWFSPSSYPLLNYMPCLFESLLALVTLLTIFLNALTQVLLEGTIARPLFGHSATLLPKWDEDFSTALLRLGTASLEATGVAGLGNEVSGVSVPAMTETMRRQKYTEYGAVEVSRFGVNFISPMAEVSGGRRRVKSGFANEIRHVKPISGDTDAWFDASWYREFAKLACALMKCIRGLWRLLCRTMRGHRHPPVRMLETMEWNGHMNHMSEDAQDEEADVYEQFLRGDDISDDDEDFGSHRESTPSGTSSGPSEFGDSDDAAAFQELCTDFVTASTASVDAQLLLAHMTDSSCSPLTRRKYGKLVDGSDEGARQILRESPDDTRTIADNGDYQPQEGSVGSRRPCVVCTIEPRQIICWPCRCLSLCDDCRENLATRSSASKHKCPCCRSVVEGYSRIFIP